MVSINVTKNPAESIFPLLSVTYNVPVTIPSKLQVNVSILNVLLSIAQSSNDPLSTESTETIYLPDSSM